MKIGIVGWAGKGDEVITTGIDVNVGIGVGEATV